MHVDELYEYGIPNEVIRILKEEGIETLYPPQEEAVKQGILELKNSFVISIPTASGKTLIAELLMLRSILERGGKCLYIVPLRALASEKFEEFKKYDKLGIKVAISTGDYDSADAWLANYDIIITTSEKADSLLRHKSTWLNKVDVLIADEIHLIHDAERGPTLEVTIAKLRKLNPTILILALSATIKNVDEVASWLKAKSIQSSWRPVTLREGIYFENEIFFSDSKTLKIDGMIKSSPLNLALDTVKNSGQSLVFVNTRQAAERSALDASPLIKKLLSSAEEKQLKRLAKEILHVLPEPTKMCKKLAKSIEGGTAFHHAGLATKQRKIVEEAFKSNLIKILSATPTLAAGVNLPARRVIIRDYTRFEAALGRSEIPVLEYKQMCGRAGRPKYDTCGEAVLIAKNAAERDYLLENYILAEPERIYSKLAVEAALRTHVLATIAMEYANSFDSLLEFFSKTFFAYQQETYLLEAHIHKITNFLLREGFCSEKNEMLFATLFGRRTSELYIDPMSAVILRDALFEAGKRKTEDISYLHTIATTPELGSLYLRQKDYEWCSEAVYENREYFLTEIPDEATDYWKFEEFLAEMKMALFLKDWTEERSEEFILEKYNLAPGDIRSKIQIADWLLYSMGEIGKIFKLQVTEVGMLRERVRHGIKEELLELVSLQGIGRARARRLYASGFKTLGDLKKAEVGELSKVKLIGRKTAESIKKQLSGESEEIDTLGEKKQNQMSILDF